MDAITIHTIVLIFSGIITVAIGYKIQGKYRKNYYFLSMFIPLCFLWASISIFSPELLHNFTKLFNTNFDSLTEEKLVASKREPHDNSAKPKWRLNEDSYSKNRNRYKKQETASLADASSASTTANKSRDLKEEELKLLEKIKNNTKNNINDVDLTLDLADIYIAQDRLDKAIELIKDIDHKSDNNDDIKLKLSKAYFAKGLYFAENKKYDQALAYLRMAVNNAPKDAYFLEDIKYFINKTNELKNSPTQDHLANESK